METLLNRGDLVDYIDDTTIVGELKTYYRHEDLAAWNFGAVVIRVVITFGLKCFLNWRRIRSN